MRHQAQSRAPGQASFAMFSSSYAVSLKPTAFAYSIEYIKPKR